MGNHRIRHKEWMGWARSNDDGRSRERDMVDQKPCPEKWRDQIQDEQELGLNADGENIYVKEGNCDVMLDLRNPTKAVYFIKKA